MRSSAREGGQSDDALSLGHASEVDALTDHEKLDADHLAVGAIVHKRVGAGLARTTGLAIAETDVDRIGLIVVRESIRLSSFLVGKKQRHDQEDRRKPPSNDHPNVATSDAGERTFDLLVPVGALGSAEYGGDILTTDLVVLHPAECVLREPELHRHVPLAQITACLTSSMPGIAARVASSSGVSSRSTVSTMIA